MALVHGLGIEETKFGSNQVVLSSGSSLDARAPGESGTANSTPGSPGFDEVIGKFRGEIIVSPKMESPGNGERRLRCGM